MGGGEHHYLGLFWRSEANATVGVGTVTTTSVTAGTNATPGITSATAIVNPLGNLYVNTGSLAQAFSRLALLVLLEIFMLILDRLGSGSFDSYRKSTW